MNKWSCGLGNLRHNKDSSLSWLQTLDSGCSKQANEILNWEKWGVTLLYTLKINRVAAKSSHVKRLFNILVSSFFSVSKNFLPSQKSHARITNLKFKDCAWERYMGKLWWSQVTILSSRFDNLCALLYNCMRMSWANKIQIRMLYTHIVSSFKSNSKF